MRETDIYEEGRDDAIALGITQGISQGIAQGAEQAKIEMARKFLNMNLSLEQVVQGTGLSLEIVEQLAKEQESQD